jgi:hypothetical protein
MAKKRKKAAARKSKSKAAAKRKTSRKKKRVKLTAKSLKSRAAKTTKKKRGIFGDTDTGPMGDDTVTDSFPAKQDKGNPGDIAPAGYDADN